MKKSLFFFTILLASFSVHSARAQANLSDKGFWVVETNIHTPWQSTICIYNNDTVLVYKEHISNAFVDTGRKRTKRRLEKIVTQSVAAWERDHVVREDQRWVAEALR